MKECTLPRRYDFVYIIYIKLATVRTLYYMCATCYMHTVRLITESTESGGVLEKVCVGVSFNVYDRRTHIHICICGT